MDGNIWEFREIQLIEEHSRVNLIIVAWATYSLDSI